MKWFLISIFFLPFSVNAQLRLNKVFTDNMVLQRDKPVHIWGKGIPGKNVEVTFANKKRNTKVKIDSTWIVEFAKQKENAAAKSIIIKSGNENVELKNILIGDVWLCIGQSNMEWPMVKGMDEAKTREELLNKYNIEVGGGLGVFAGKIWPIGIIGESCTMNHLNMLTGALEKLI